MNVAIIAAAGQGVRMGGKRAKQFLELAGTPVIFHTLARFEQCDAIQEIIVVLPPADVATFLTRAGARHLRKLSQVVPGGATRAESVFRGVQAVKETTAEIIAVHDGVRPFVSPDEIARTVAAAELAGAAIMVAPVTDTIKKIDGEIVVNTLSRTELRRALTPQCFRYSLLREAYSAVDLSDPEITDESVLVERLGQRVAVVEGNPRNIKITCPADLEMAELFLKQMTDS